MSWPARSHQRLALGLVLVGLTLTLPAGAADDPGAGLSSYALRANAPGLGLGGIYPNVDLTVPEAQSSLTTGGVGAGLAALAWPGPVFGNLGDTVLIVQPTAPGQVKNANDPIRAETRSGGTQQASNTSLPGTVMTSTAKPSLVSASSQTGDRTTLPIGTVGAITGTSQVGLTGRTGATATATSTVSRLSLANGAITIASATSTAAATSDGLQASAHGSTTATGIVVAGVPVVVDGTGIHLAGQSADNPVPQQTLNTATAALGLTMLVTSPRTVTQRGSVRYDTGALVVLFRQGTQSLAVTVGRASVAIDATRALANADAGQPQALQPQAPQRATLPVGSPHTSIALPGGPVLPGGALAPTTGAAQVTAGLAPAVAPAAGAAGPAVLVPVGYALPTGVPLALTLVGLLAAGLAGLALRRLPLRLFATPTAPCNEGLS